MGGGAVLVQAWAQARVWVDTPPQDQPCRGCRHQEPPRAFQHRELESAAGARCRLCQGQGSLDVLDHTQPLPQAPPLLSARRRRCRALEHEVRAWHQHQQQQPHPAPTHHSQQDQPPPSSLHLLLRHQAARGDEAAPSDHRREVAQRLVEVPAPLHRQVPVSLRLLPEPPAAHLRGHDRLPELAQRRPPRGGGRGGEAREQQQEEEAGDRCRRRVCKDVSRPAEQTIERVPPTRAQRAHDAHGVASLETLEGSGAQLRAA
mmetsp:Transcript_3124/g.6109  ORF Transcript_3124/g.6109 Transcript_3124/m.6109 type:complete len:260 (-) Transcript_3124:435-1214(-)